MTWQPGGYYYGCDSYSLVWYDPWQRYIPYNVYVTLVTPVATVTPVVTTTAVATPAVAATRQWLRLRRPARLVLCRATPRSKPISL